MSVSITIAPYVPWYLRLNDYIMPSRATILSSPMQGVKHETSVSLSGCAC